MNDPIVPPPFPHRKRTLANGLDVIVARRAGPPTVAVNLWYHVGSKNEERNRRGFAHLFEHLMFEGSEHYPGDFFKHLQPLGAAVNGSTSADRTNYFVDLPAAHLERVLAMESDRMGFLVPALDEKKLNVQRDVVKNEYRQNYANRPYGQAWRILAEAMYPPQHPYSWQTIGVMEDLDAASVGDVAAFFQRFYVPANASLAVVGDVPEDEAFEMVERYFGPIPGGEPALRPWTPAVDRGAWKALEVVDRVELDRCYVAWHSVPQFDFWDAPLSLLADVLAKGRSSRLYRKLVLEKQTAQDVTVFQSGRELAGTFGAVVTLRPGADPNEARGDVFEAIDSVVEEGGVREEELERVKTMRASAFLFALERAGGFGGVADRLNAYNVYQGDPSRITTDLKRFMDVTASLLRDAAVTHLYDRKGNYPVCLTIRGRKPAGGIAKADRASPPASRKPAAFRAPLPEVRTLSNGLPVWILPARELPTVAVCVAIRGGGGMQPIDRPGLAEIVAATLDEGTNSRSAERIAAEVESMGTSLSASCGWDGAYVSSRCLKSAFDRTLDLTVDVLREAAFPEAEWERVRGQSVAALRSARDSADARAHRALLKALYPEGHPYRHPLAGVESVVAGLGREEAVAFRDRTFAPGVAAVAVAGDVDPDGVAAMLEARLGDWRGEADAPPAVESPSRARRPRILLLDRPGAPQAAVRIGHVGIARLDPDYDPLTLFNQVLGGQFTSRLNAKLREERGFTYGVRSGFDARRGAGPFTISAALQADELAVALDDVRGELLAALGDRPPSRAEIDEARRSLAEGWARHFETPGALVGRYAGVFVQGLPLDHLASFPARMADVAAADVVEAARRHVRPDALTIAVVADADRVRGRLASLSWADLEEVED